MFLNIALYAFFDISDKKKDYMIKKMPFLYEIHQTSGYSIYRFIGK